MKFYDISRENKSSELLQSDIFLDTFLHGILWKIYVARN